jgi:hypothetical protein
MKKILLFIATASLFIACDETKDELEIYNVFFGASDKLSALTEYEGVTTSYVYSPDFYSSGGTDVVDWYSEGATATVDNGILRIKTSSNKNNPAGIRFDFSPVRELQDFQVEAFLKPEVFPSGTEQGLIFDINESDESFGYFVYSTSGSSFLTGHQNGDDDWYTGDMEISTSTYHLFTVRKNRQEVSLLPGQAISVCD